ncbi:SDR family oxidoreductase [Stutzerimonas zhaodongensis]|uniref:SDR family oxidoreductase n=1 Tax=Stutzerimonas zhaodongensis TaxID=1176257 RepID=A0A3M2HJ97_9GAMM|nr:SDR family oxidoreductase [Stutzerimonas zhaodongensis]MCQ4317836.1 SDR family oxidoreductase [Stutzerimonas zhaodongensis]RMH87650.1 SDR family oxidoreductase [Stutzerimonas zhaodongensis]
MTFTGERTELVVITGASSGIGAATANELARRGFHVLAGVRNDRDADTIRAIGIEPVILDITEPRHIRALAERVEGDALGRNLRALINNAGVGVNSPVEVFELDEWRSLFEVNLFGQVATIQALLPALIRCRGRVINISSVGGKVAMGTYGPYAATKFALEAVSDSLRREISHLGVHVVVVEPGAVKTKIAGQAIAKANDIASSMTLEQSQRYGQLIQAITAQTAAITDKSGLPASVAAKVIVKAVTARVPRTRYPIGREATLLPLLGLLPDRLLDRILNSILRPYYPS